MILIRIKEKEKSFNVFKYLKFYLFYFVRAGQLIVQICYVCETLFIKFTQSEKKTELYSRILFLKIAF